jgi:hypothetical protein
MDRANVLIFISKLLRRSCCPIGHRGRLSKHAAEFHPLTFEVSRKSVTRVVKIELQEVQELDYSCTKDDPPIAIEFVKSLTTDGGDFYLSLDPYDERENFVSENDFQFFRSRRVKLTTHDSAQTAST